MSPVMEASGAWQEMQRPVTVSPRAAFASARKAWNTGFVHACDIEEVSHCFLIGPWHDEQIFALRGSAASAAGEPAIPAPRPATAKARERGREARAFIPVVPLPRRR